MGNAGKTTPSHAEEGPSCVTSLDDLTWPASHLASLKLASLQAAIAKGRPLITGFSNRVEIAPLGSCGLRPAQ